MSRSPLFLDDVNERQALFGRRTVLFGGLAGAGLLALGGRLVQLQLLEAGSVARQRIESSKQALNHMVAAP